jgi:predicted nucleic acid-binding protein
MSGLARARTSFALSRRFAFEYVGQTGVKDELKVLSDVAAGIYSIAEFDRFDVAQAAAVIERYQQLRIGLADASLVVLAAKHGTTRLLTFDERHFRVIRPLRADASGCCQPTARSP